MNLGPKRKKLNAAFKTFQHLPPPLPKSNGRRQVPENAPRLQPLPSSASPASPPGQQLLAE
jgi:hypothetical protein